MKLAVKILLATILFGCLLQMPYGYYQFVRLATCIGFAWLTYIEYEQKRPIMSVLLILVAILFNPIFKIYFSREAWNIIDIVVAVGLVIWIVVSLVRDNNYQK